MWALLAGQEEEIIEVIMHSSVESIPERIMEHSVELAVSSGNAGSSGLGVKSTTSDAVTAVGKSCGQVLTPGTAKHSVSTESEVAVSPGDAGSSGPGVTDTMSVRRHSSREVCW